MFSIAVRSRRSAASERRARWRCSVTSTAMPISWISGASGSTTWARARIHTHWPSAWRMRNTWSMWSISRATILLASRTGRRPRVDDPVDLAEGQHACRTARSRACRTSSATSTSCRAPCPSPTGRSGRAPAPCRCADALRDRCGRRPGRGRLAEIGVEDDDQHAGGQHEQGDVERDGLAPIVRTPRSAAPAPPRRRSRSCVVRPRRVPVRPVDADIHDAGALAEHEQRLAALIRAVERLPSQAAGMRRSRDDLEVAVGDGEHIARRRSPRAGWSAAAGRLQRAPARRPVRRPACAH